MPDFVFFVRLDLDFCGFVLLFLFPTVRCNKMTIKFRKNNYYFLFVDSKLPLPFVCKINCRNLPRIIEKYYKILLFMASPQPKFPTGLFSTRLQRYVRLNPTSNHGAAWA